jgi:hypothetical protein
LAGGVSTVSGLISAGGAIAAGSATDFAASASVGGGSDLQPPEINAKVTIENASKDERIMRGNLWEQE